MILYINGKQEQLPEDGAKISVTQLLELKKVEMPHAVSVELNGKIVPRNGFGSTFLHESDEVEFLYFMGGGDGSRARERSGRAGFLGG